MLPINIGPTLLTLAKESRRDDLRRAAEYRLAREGKPAAAPRNRRRHPWWWGLARTQPTTRTQPTA